jgi:hypothetical protein
VNRNQSVKQKHNSGLSLRKKTAIATDTLCLLSLTFQLIFVTQLNYWIINPLINNDYLRVEKINVSQIQPLTNKSIPCRFCPCESSNSVQVYSRIPLLLIILLLWEMCKILIYFIHSDLLH